MIRVNSILFIGAFIYLSAVCFYYYATEKRAKQAYSAMEEKYDRYESWVNSCQLLNDNISYTSELVEEFNLYRKKDYSIFPIKYRKIQNKIDSLDYFTSALSGSGVCGIDRFNLLRDDLSKEIYLCSRNRLYGLCQQYEMFINGIAQPTHRYNNLVLIPRRDSTLVEFKKYQLNFQEEKLDTLIDRRMVYIE